MPTSDRAPRPSATADHGRRDALLWTLAIALLVLKPGGWVSGDGLGYATTIGRGAWSWNPNHLLFEPLLAVWSELLDRIGVGLPIVDRLRLLSVLAAALAAGLFRWGVASRLAAERATRPDRFHANVMTACFVLGATYLQRAVADEPFMIRMPLLAIAAIAILRVLERPSPRRALGAGAALGGAALWFLADGLFALTVAAAFAAYLRRERSSRLALAAAGSVLGGAAAVAGVGFVTAWWRVRPGPPLLHWLTSYGGDAESARVDLVFGTPFTLAGVAGAAMRTAYGCANALVDLIPAVAAARDDGAIVKAALIGGVWLAAAVAIAGGAVRVWRRRHADASARDVLLLQGIWWPPVVAFGLYWNDSANQFYLPLAFALAPLAPRPQGAGRRGAALLLCLGVALAWNGADVARRFVFYPRAERMAALERETAGAGLLVTPGWDDASNLAALSTTLAAIPRLELAPLAVEVDAAAGLQRIDRAIATCLASGWRVDLIDLYDVPPRRAPWKLLLTLGWERSELHRALAAYPLDARSRLASGFTLRSIPASRTGGE